MKKIYVCLIAAVIALGAFYSCKKIIRKIFQGIDAEIPAFTVTLPAIPYAPPTEIAIGTLTQEFNLDSTIRANTSGVYGANDISSVKVKQIVFSLANGDEQNNISNFESTRLLFSSNTKSDTVTIASITFPDTLAMSYTYTPVNSPELKPYLSGTVLYYTAFGKLRRATTKPLDLGIQVTLRVE
jgi:hypothetical protein